MFKNILVLFLCLLVSEVTSAQQPSFERRILVSKLDDPWSISCGTDGYLWITESKSYQVSRINPQSGSRDIVLDLNDKRLFPRYDTLETGDKPWPQGGLMGLALHPKFSDGQPYVYLAYVYQFTGAEQEDDGFFRKIQGYQFTAKLVRYRYDADSRLLVDEEVIDENIPASNDHNGGRLIIAPMDETYYLFYAVGDMGAGQFRNGSRTNYAQDPTVKEGKILRYRIHADSSRSGVDAWIPDNNPFNIDTFSSVYSLGHRNPQGLAWARIGEYFLLYSCEHGAFSDDEINLIESGKNFGHPLIMGYADGNYDGLAAAASDNKDLPGQWHTSYPLIESEQASARQIGETYSDPIYSFMPSKNEYLREKMENILASKAADWQSVAPSSLIYYQYDAIPEWKNSLLVTTLKGGALFRLSLDADGNAIQGEPEKLFEGNQRYRDICIFPDGSKFYMITDKSAVTSGPTEENPDETNLRGCIIEYTLK